MTHLVLLNALKGLQTNISLVLQVTAQSVYSIIPRFILYFPHISIFFVSDEKSAVLI